MGDPIPALVEEGGGYWCFRVPEPKEPQIVGYDDGESLPDPDELTMDFIEAYHPVNVSVNDKGEAYAWFHYDYDDPMKAMELNGRRYVPMEQVYLEPLRDFVNIRDTEAEIP